eukprot:GHRR01034688.1.p1 GENE.GHRR01034688.1~~GHRR01034688.1.p1  ORF type:complete len:128 (-),score=14.76 GHRR01034688.1:11-394(-)
MTNKGANCSAMLCHMELVQHAVHVCQQYANQSNHCTAQVSWPTSASALGEALRESLHWATAKYICSLACPTLRLTHMNTKPAVISKVAAMSTRPCRTKYNVRQFTGALNTSAHSGSLAPLHSHPPAA